MKKIEEYWQRGLKKLKPTKKQLDHGLKLHKRFTVCDSFGFMPTVWTTELFKTLNQKVKDGIGAQEWLHEATQLRMHNMTTDQKGAEEFAAALKASGVSCIVHNVGGEGPVEKYLPNMAARMHTCRILRKYLFQAGSSAEIKEAKKQKRTAIIFSVNGPPGRPDKHEDMYKWLPVWYHLGVRLMHLSYNRRNNIAGGCTEANDDGLSDFGRDYIRKLNEVGIIIDVPHSSRQTLLDSARLSSKPIMASHTGVKSLFDHVRCKTDEELKAIADTDGLIGIYNYPNMLGPSGDIFKLLDHIDAAVKIIGVRHVSFGTDLSYCPGVWPPKQIKCPPSIEAVRKKASRAAGWKKKSGEFSSNDHITGSLAWTNWPLFTVGLVMRGYKDSDIEKILGKNLMRVLDANRPENEVCL